MSHSIYSELTGKTVVTLRTLDGQEVVRCFPGGHEPEETVVHRGPLTYLVSARGEIHGVLDNRRVLLADFC